MTFSPPPRPQLVAHKGNSWQHPENTWASVHSAIDAGADVVEIDVSVTADGIAAVVHGPTLQASTTAQGLVSRVPWSVVADARTRRRDGTVSEERVPRLDELLDALGARTRWNIDLKDKRAADPVLRVVHDLGIASRVVLSGSRAARVRRVLRRDPGVAMLVDLDRLDQLFALWPTHRVAWLCRRYGSLLGDPLVAGLNVDARFVDAALVERVHALGAELWTFTVDVQARVDHLVSLGVDSITTNRPTEVAVPRHGS